MHIFTLRTSIVPSLSKLFSSPSCRWPDVRYSRISHAQCKIRTVIQRLVSDPQIYDVMHFSSYIDKYAVQMYYYPLLVETIDVRPSSIRKFKEDETNQRTHIMNNISKISLKNIKNRLKRKDDVKSHLDVFVTGDSKGITYYSLHQILDGVKMSSLQYRNWNAGEGQRAGEYVRSLSWYGICENPALTLDEGLTSVFTTSPPKELYSHRQSDRPHDAVQETDKFVKSHLTWFYFFRNNTGDISNPQNIIQWLSDIHSVRESSGSREFGHGFGDFSAHYTPTITNYDLQLLCSSIPRTLLRNIYSSKITDILGQSLSRVDRRKVINITPYIEGLMYVYDSIGRDLYVRYNPSSTSHPHRYGKEYVYTGHKRDAAQSDYIGPEEGGGSGVDGDNDGRMYYSQRMSKYHELVLGLEQCKVGGNMTIKVDDLVNKVYVDILYLFTFAFS